MLTTMISSVLLATAAATPLGPGQEARLTALLAWAEAYRDCYEPAPDSLRIDERFTAECVQMTLRKIGDDGPAEQRAAMAALIAKTPELISLLNAPAHPAPKQAGSPQPPRQNHAAEARPAPPLSPAARP